MTGAELRTIRERWGLSQAEMGEALGVGGDSEGGRKTTIYRYEADRVPINPTLAKLVRCMDKAGAPAAD